MIPPRPCLPSFSFFFVLSSYLPFLLIPPTSHYPSPLYTSTKSVLHGHLKDANDQVAHSSASAADATEAASKCESAYAALAVAKDTAASTVC